MKEHRKTKPVLTAQMHRWLKNKQVKTEPAIASQNANAVSGSLKIPRKLGKFPITRVLGSGGMGKVYLGYHPDLDIPVAIKTIKSSLLNIPHFVDRFIREARLATKLNHQNVVRIYDVDKDGDLYFIVEEFVDGNDLGKILNTNHHNRLDPDTALGIAIGITKALVEAEKFKIVHRDIKPSNILITGDGMAKLSDLGLAKQYLTGDSTESKKIEFTRSESSLGSPAYMAPEQVMDARNVDIRADIYSLGATFYHMVTGNIPFTGKTTKVIMAKRIHEEAPTAYRVNKNLSARMSGIISTMMAKNPHDRYQHPTELLQELEELKRPEDQRKKMLIMLVMVLSVTLAISLFFSLSKQKHVIDPFAQVENNLLERNFNQALVSLKGIRDQTTREDKFVYAQGLCHLAQNNHHKLRGCIEKLENLEKGLEKAKHLEVLSHLSENYLDSALTMVNEWLPKVTHKSPFLQSQGIALLKLGKITEAQRSFEKGLQEKSYFDFQKLEALDHLAKLLAKDGKFNEASALYSGALDHNASLLSGSTVSTNYAVTLMNSGNYEKAAQILKHVSHSNPKDEMVLYLQKEINDYTNQSDTVKFREIMGMIDDINQSMEDRTDQSDNWTSTPFILTFLPLKNTNSFTGRLSIERLWSDQLITTVKEQITFPIVDRVSMDHILRELKLTASELTSPEARLKLGRLLPASMLVKGTFTENEKILGLNLQLVDVQTSELVAVISEKIENGNRQKLLQNVCLRLQKILQDRHPVKGKIITVEGNDYEINIGLYHGVRNGQSVRIYRPDENNVSSRLLARKPPIVIATVSGVGKITAIIQVHEKTSEPIVPNMLVLTNFSSSEK